MVLVRIKLWSMKELEGTIEYVSRLTFLHETRFLPFLVKFDMFNSTITLEFLRIFNGKTMFIGSLEFQVTEQFISRATELATTGEKRFKKEEVDKGVWHQFLIEENHVVY